ncbi:MAG: HDIG domain-containing metalloprotein [Pleomorphochaeta sp.]
MTRDEALSLLKKYNQSEALINHGKAVEAVMKAFAKYYGEDEEYWGNVGLLHDLDYEKWPEQHCVKTEELLKEENVDDAFIRAICSHGWKICTDIEPKLQMEKTLYTIDELCGLINATALMRPTKMEGMSVKSVKKKFKSSGFAAGVNREVIEEGAKLMDMELSKVMEISIKAMQESASDIGL